VKIFNQQLNIKTKFCNHNVCNVMPIVLRKKLLLLGAG